MLLPKVVQEWREPSYPDFIDRTIWSLFNAFTTAMGSRQQSNPQQHASLTMKVYGLLGESAGFRPDAVPVDMAA